MLLSSATPPPEYQQYEVVLEGRPGKRVIIGQTEVGWTVHEEELDRDDSKEYLVRVVTDRRGNYFWASRGMRPMAREESEGFVTYSAGRFGYVKVMKESTLDVVRDIYGLCSHRDIGVVIPDEAVPIIVGSLGR